MSPVMNPIFILVFLFTPFLHTIHAQFNTTLTNWIAVENATALSRIFANIGPTGQFVPDADPGAIVAAPSTASPNYYYQVSPLSSNFLIYSGSATPR